jgi:hypothetical protein
MEHRERRSRVLCRLRTRYPLSAIMLALVIGCGGDEEKKPPKPAGPPEIRILELRASGNQLWRRNDAAPLELGCDRTLAASFDWINWTPRPPGGCGDRLQCGFFRLHVSAVGDDASSASKDSAIGVASIDLSGLAFSSSRHLFRAELRNDDGSLFVSVDGNPEDGVEVDLTLASGCSDADASTPDAGSPDAGSGGAAGQAGAGGLAGQAGAAGVAGAGGV